MSTYTYPVPTPRGEETLYYEALGRGELVFGRCGSCARPHFYPRTICPHCGADAVELVTASGRGRVYTFTTQYRAGAPSMKDAVPYSIAMVDLDEGVRVMADVVGAGREHVAIGDEVRVVIEHRPPEPSILHVELALHMELAEGGAR